MSHVLYHVEAGIGWITLDRPDKLNALTHAMGEAIAALVRRLNADPAVRVVVLKGNGRHFSSGGDLEWLRENMQRPVAENTVGMREFYGKFLSLRELNVPSIAMIHGRATGAGLALAMACDLRVAELEAKVSANFVRLGLNPGMGTTYHLERLVGQGRAAELILTGRDVEMGEALAIGLVNHLAASDVLLETTRRLAEAIAANAPLAVRLAKGIMRRDASSLVEVLGLEAEGQAQCFASHDLQEGLEAIAARRAPNFKGN